MTGDPVPQRLSDAERDAAVAMLREHFEAGRLTEGEFSERMGSALQARFPAELTPLFGDLPAPRPEGDDAPAPPSLTPWTAAGPPSEWSPGSDRWTPAPAPAAPADQTARLLGLAQALLWPVCIVAFLTSGHLVWIGVAIIGGIVLTYLRNNRPPSGPLDGRTPPPGIGR